MTRFTFKNLINGLARGQFLSYKFEKPFLGLLASVRPRELLDQRLRIAIGHSYKGIMVRSIKFLSGLSKKNIRGSQG